MKLYILLFFICAFIYTTPNVLAIEEPVSPILISKDVSYSIDNELIKGYLVTNSQNYKKPGILIIPNREKINTFSKEQANKFAEVGYSVLVIDIYNDIPKAKNQLISSEFSGSYRETLRKRIKKTTVFFTENELIDKDNLAIIGYSLGGDIIIDYMLDDETYKAGISFYGFYNSPQKKSGILNERLQVHHGKLDTLSNLEDLNIFLDFNPKTEVHIYPNAKHDFNDPNSYNYDEDVASNSFEAAKSFLRRKLNCNSPNKILDYHLFIDASKQLVFSYLQNRKEEVFVGTITSYNPNDYYEIDYSNNKFSLKLAYSLIARNGGTELTLIAYSTKENFITNLRNKHTLKKQMKKLKGNIESSKK